MAMDAEVADLLDLRVAFLEAEGDPPGPVSALFGPESYVRASAAAADLAGSAGMFGFDRLAAIGLGFERAIQSGAPETSTLAAGLPVVATPLPALAGRVEVAIASDAAGMAAALDEALLHDSPQRRAERSAAAASHSWDRRLEEIAAAIDAL